MECWLHATTDPSGLCNQLTAVYAYAKVALVLNCTTVVLGPMFSRLHFDQSFSGFYNIQSGRHALPFSAFFDLEHYQAYWQRHGLQVIQMDPNELANITLVHLPGFQKRTYSETELTLLALHHSAPSTAVEQLRVLEFVPSLVATYNFHQGAPEYIDLRMASESLRPSPNIASAVDALITQLGQPYIAVHLRLEVDMITAVPEFLEALAEFVNAVLVKQSEERKPVYLATGLFQSGMDTTRGDIVALTFRHAGIEIQHRESIARSAMADGDSSLSDLLSSMMPEQLAMVDLQMMRHACDTILPTRKVSSFSYMVQRLRNLDAGGPISFDGIPAESLVLRNWGI